jgi:hypothetical protein
MLEQSREEVVLVIMEHGSTWPSWVEECRTRTPDAIVIAQQNDEAPAELALRVMHRLGVLEARGRTVATSVLAAGDGSDDEIFEARCRVARALLDHMSSQGSSGGLVFAGHGAGYAEGRHELMSLAGTLMDQLAGTELSIGLRFGYADAPDSGLWACGADRPDAEPSAA